MSRLKAPIIQLVGQRLTPELADLARELQNHGVVYRFDSTRDLIAAWQLARRNGAAQELAATAVAWLQSRPGEFRQREIDVVAECDPLARPIVVAGCWSEGEPRSGHPLARVTRIYWHQGLAALLPLVTQRSPTQQLAAEWAAVHVSQFVDYQGIAGACQAIALKTIWQNDRWPTISSEPALRLFVQWETWRDWRERTANSRGPRAKELLLLSFPRPADFEHAAAVGIAGVLAQPFTAADLLRTMQTAQQTQPADPPLTIPFGSATSPVKPKTSATPYIRQLQSA